VIGGFFIWAVGMGYIPANPIPNTRQNPQFRIPLREREVAPPTKKEVEKVLATATGRVKVLCELMRWTVMALVDAQKQAGLIASVTTDGLILMHTNRFVC
jgi:hypothetical protein